MVALLVDRGAAVDQAVNDRSGLTPLVVAAKVRVHVRSWQ